ncbi:hypothetical protein B7463_g8767, partial [Scytalidium lignicola]
MKNSTSRPVILQDLGGKEQYVTRFGHTVTRIRLQCIQDIGDTYEPGTIRERVYQLGMSTIHQSDSIEEIAQLANMVMTDDIQVLEALEEAETAKKGEELE